MGLSYTGHLPCGHFSVSNHCFAFVQPQEGSEHSPNPKFPTGFQRVHFSHAAFLAARLASLATGKPTEAHRIIALAPFHALFHKETGACGVPHRLVIFRKAATSISIPSPTVAPASSKATRVPGHILSKRSIAAAESAVLILEHNRVRKKAGRIASMRKVWQT